MSEEGIMNSEVPHQDGQELIEVNANSERRVGKWAPVVKDETIQLLGNKSLSKDSKQHISDEAVSILSRCVPPTSDKGQETGLVIGYIQSGKTLSFTTVAALSRDNQFAMIIVIAGTSIPLTEQSYKRLRKDLQIDESQDRKWRHFHNPTLKNKDNKRIGSILDEWGDQNVPTEEKRTILITVMKYHKRLRDLINVLRALDLDNIPTLIIDDEADQAGLNNLIKEGEESTTYQCLRTLREVVPHHTFLQYTATPQGPLLINLIDVLSPDFALTLSPGEDYIGGKDFFFDGSPYIREIPSDEISINNDPLEEPPSSLLQALRLFFLGVAIGLIRDKGRGNRSMMIHPSQRTISHVQFLRWVENIMRDWKQVLANNEDPDYAELINDFRESYDDLKQTVPDLEPFDYVAKRLLDAIRKTEPLEINATGGKTPPVDWRGSYSYILVGGQALDRGFTVEGLTVTYMPRSIGTGNADTIQQRARFFGYKRGYLGFCRIFVDQQVAAAFTRYVQHEESIRRQIDKHAKSGLGLQDLRRAFLLTRELRPTRDSIIDVKYVRVNISEGWFYPKAPHECSKGLGNNVSTVKGFINSLEFEIDEGSPDRTEIQIHNVSCNVPLQKVYDELLLNLFFARLNDAQNFLGILVIIKNYLEQNKDAVCTVYQMSKGISRKRELNENEEIRNLFQGESPVNPIEVRGTIYPGDRSIRGNEGITIQIHNLTIPKFTRDHPEYQVIPNIAVYIPREVAGDVIIQEQRSTEDYVGE